MEFALRRPSRRLIVAAVLLAVLVVVVYVVGRPGGETVAGYAYPVPQSDADNVIEVLNGTPQAGLASRGTDALRARGFDVVFFGNGPAVDSTQILIRRMPDRIGDRLAEALGTGLVTVAEDSLRRVAATVILGPDYQPPATLAP